MRRGAAGLAASLGLALVLTCPGALAAKKPLRSPQPVSIPARVAGAITFAWHGDPARGCAAAGVCDVRGSLVFAPDDVSAEGTRVPHVGLVPDSIVVDSIDTPTMVRVRRDPPGGTPSTCVDTLNTGFAFLSATPLDRGHLRFDFSDAGLPQSGLSAGRCAGPLTSDLRGKFPAGALDLTAMRRGSALVNLSGRQPLAFGAYSGEVVSTLGVRLGARSGSNLGGDFISGSSGSSRPLHRRRVRVLVLGAEYRFTGFDGALVTSFHGANSPLCRALDACGASGTISYSPTDKAGRLIVAGTRRLRHGEKPTLRSALRDLRAGRLAVFGEVRLNPDAVALVSSSVTRPDDVTCTDTATPAFARFSALGSSRSLELRLGKPTSPLDEPPAADGLRTRCPGPSQTDALARGSLAVGRIALAKVGAKSLTVSLSRPGTFDAGAYVGTRSGGLTLRLERVRLKAGVIRRSVLH